MGSNPIFPAINRCNFMYNFICNLCNEHHSCKPTKHCIQSGHCICDRCYKIMGKNIKCSTKKLTNSEVVALEL
jgi:hypothetical protein